MTALDTSVVIAAFAPWHEAHTAARRAVTPDAVVPAHAVTETYSVLTRMPEPFRIDAPTVAAYLHRQWGGRVLTPDAELHGSLPAAAAAAGVLGGGTYDALVGLTADRFGHELLSLDVRAERTYQSLGIAYRLLAQ
ncbi:MAG: PIN domain-containing protein [Actinomycetia bacterium]|nr:PIN domain-containing protein [Actinomycetes bacterium]